MQGLAYGFTDFFLAPVLITRLTSYRLVILTKMQYSILQLFPRNLDHRLCCTKKKEPPLNFSASVCTQIFLGSRDIQMIIENKKDVHCVSGISAPDNLVNLHKEISLRHLFIYACLPDTYPSNLH